MLLNITPLTSNSVINKLITETPKLHAYNIWIYLYRINRIIPAKYLLKKDYNLNS